VKRLLAVTAFVALSVSVAQAAPTPKPVHASAHRAPVVPVVVHLSYRVAPADEYFGRLKMSILGIRNALRDMGLRADADPAHAASILGTVGLTEDAMRDWERKYPHDTWIPPAILQLERDYAKVDSDDARDHAKVVMVWLVHDYPGSAPGKLGKSELARNLVGVKPPAELEAAALAAPAAAVDAPAAPAPSPAPAAPTPPPAPAPPASPAP
jgi:hypothetical protein